MEGDLPRFITATPEYLRRMRDEKESRGGSLVDLIAGPRKKKKRKGRWA
jgi:hypothetical protein